MGDAHAAIRAPAAEPGSGRPLDVDSFCEACGYNLRGQTARRCPECGRPFSAAAAGGSRIPWEHRDRLGRLRAYAMTVVLATFRPAALAEEVARPVSQAAARRFRRVTLVLALPTPAAVTAWAWREAGLRPAGTSPVLQGLWWAAVGLAAVLFLGLATAVQRFFRAGSIAADSAGRARALSHYACGPLAFTPLVFGLGALFLWGNDYHPPAASTQPPYTWFFYLWGWLTLVQWAAVWRTTFRLAEGTSHYCAGDNDPVFVGFLLPFLWAALACALLVLPPVARTVVQDLLARR